MIAQLMAKKAKSDRLTVSIDSDLKRQFDTICTWKGLNMSDVTQLLISDWVKSNAPPGLLTSEEQAS
ncbi:plasmid partition protein ParG [Aetokthonos hydrillicola]|jgi:antitoxin component of RelBE/YafQ-DinJ toxin-antitoxin module|nr:plasmid partition protein ParG [Aetokthonos hydrillicola]